MKRRRLGANVVALGAAGVMAFPVYWMFVTALKRPGDIMRSTPHFLPWPISVDNFSRALDDPNFWTYARNSIVVSLVTVVLAMALAVGASFAVVRFTFVGRRTFLTVLVLVQMIPSSALVIPLYLVLRSIGALDQFAGLALAYLTFVLPFTIWTLRSFVAGIPIELEEAAMVDGCGRLQAFIRVVLPLLAPGMAATSIFAFINAWDDYLFAYVIMRAQTHYTLPVWIVSFQTSEGVDDGALIAASAIFSLPVLVFFLFVQRRLVGATTSGAVRA
ncbi:carbohydrate ABC transporter permease [Cryptosporangium sp. NPDC048952]|uniref:carbohydrate ABC transporter permease n=1 Tax=Cryptosporangium sp. NPDC048952 TaxID=3363961 RepID=UPI003712654C